MAYPPESCRLHVGSRTTGLVTLVASAFLAGTACNGASPGAPDSDAADSGSVADETPETRLIDIWDEMTEPVDRATWTLHDPSRIVEHDGTLVIAVTGKEQVNGYDCGLETWTLSPGDSFWQPGLCLLRDKPAWIAEELPTNDGAYWAPAFLNANTLYFAVSAGFDDDAGGSCIGLLRASGVGPEWRWEDAGRPITCSFADELSEAPHPAAIDPATFVDEEGKAWLLYGGGHIYAIEVDPDTGLSVGDGWWREDSDAHVHLANGPTVEPDGTPTDEELWVEAPYVHEHEGFLYLFVNWYSCCNGADSTYEIRVGRARSIDGPFVDAEGVPMLDGGGTLLLASEGDRIGPGHVGLFPIEVAGEPRELMTYHYYPESGTPWATVGARLLRWEDGWPEVEAQDFDLAAWLDDGVGPGPGAPGPMAAIGDSYFEFHAESGDAIPDFVGQTLGREMRNLAVSGAQLFPDDREATDEGLDIPAQLPAGEWDWLVMDGGGNDFNDQCECGSCDPLIDSYVSERGTEGRLTDFLRGVTDRGTRVVYMTYPDLPPGAEFGFDRCRDEFEVFDARLERMAAALDGVWIVHASDVVSSDDLDAFDADRVHPSVLGAERIGAHIASEILTFETAP